jgi:hypothetical protein
MGWSCLLVLIVSAVGKACSVSDLMLWSNTTGDASGKGAVYFLQRNGADWSRTPTVLNKFSPSTGKAFEFLALKLSRQC